MIFPEEFLTIAERIGAKRTKSNAVTRDSFDAYHQNDPNRCDYIGCIAELCAVYELIKRGKGFKMSALYDANPITAPDIIIETNGIKLYIDVKGTETNNKNVSEIKLNKTLKTKINAYWFFKINVQRREYNFNYHRIEEVKEWDKKYYNRNIVYQKAFN